MNCSRQSAVIWLQGARVGPMVDTAQLATCSAKLISCCEPRSRTRSALASPLKPSTCGSLKTSLLGALAFLKRSLTVLSSCSAVSRRSIRGPGLPETHLLPPEIVEGGSSEGGSCPGGGIWVLGGVPIPPVPGPGPLPGLEGPEPLSVPTPICPVQATAKIGAPTRQNFLRARNIS